MIGNSLKKDPFADLLGEDDHRNEMLIQMLKNQDLQSEADRKRRDEEYAMKLQREYE